MKYNITPKSLVLSILRKSEQNAVPIKALVSIGDLFGFTGNTIRVTTTRLIRDGKIESDERGLYHLTASADPVSRYIDTWRDGEERLVSWDGTWICCLTPKLPVGRQARNKKALGFLGFKQGLPGLWVRPNNLRLELCKIIKILRRFGLEKDVELFKASEFGEKLDEQWRRYIWPLDELKKTGEEIREKIARSKNRLKSMPLENAVVEAYLVGSEAVHRLIMDPLLPGELLDASVRIKLTEAMLEYDDLGKRVWAKKFEDIQITGAPSHLQLVEGG